MDKERACENALKFKRTRLMKNLPDTWIFALSLSNGEKGYVRVFGMNAGDQGLELYIGQKGLNSLHKTLRLMILGRAASRFDHDEYVRNADFIACIFKQKTELIDDECEVATACAKKLGMRPGGKNFYPVFVKMTPMHEEIRIVDQEETDMLAEALEAAVEAARLVKDSKGEGFLIEHVDMGQVILLSKENGEWTQRRTLIGKVEPSLYLSPEFYNDLAAAKLKRLRREGIWVVLIMVSNYVNARTGVVPTELLVLREDKEGAIPSKFIEDYEDNCGQLLDTMAQKFIEMNICPEVIRVIDPMSFAFVKDLCDRVGIELEFESRKYVDDHDDEDLLDELYDEFFGDLDGAPDAIMDRVEEMLEDGENDEIFLELFIYILLTISEYRGTPQDLKQRAKRLLDEVEKNY